MENYWNLSYHSATNEVTDYNILSIYEYVYLLVVDAMSGCKYPRLVE